MLPNGVIGGGSLSSGERSEQPFRIERGGRNLKANLQIDLAAKEGSGKNVERLGFLKDYPNDGLPLSKESFFPMTGGNRLPRPMTQLMAVPV